VIGFLEASGDVLSINKPPPRCGLLVLDSQQSVVAMLVPAMVLAILVVFPHLDVSLILAANIGHCGTGHASVGHLSVLRGTAVKAGTRPHSATLGAENPNLSEYSQEF
jgi:hypothetical protein